MAKAIVKTNLGTSKAARTRQNKIHLGSGKKKKKDGVQDCSKNNFILVINMSIKTQIRKGGSKTTSHYIISLARLAMMISGIHHRAGHLAQSHF